MDAAAFAVCVLFLCDANTDTRSNAPARRDEDRVIRPLMRSQVGQEGQFRCLCGTVVTVPLSSACFMAHFPGAISSFGAAIQLSASIRHIGAGQAREQSSLLVPRRQLGWWSWPSEFRLRTGGGSYGRMSGENSFAVGRGGCPCRRPAKGGFYFQRGKSSPAETDVYFGFFSDSRRASFVWPRCSRSRAFSIFCCLRSWVKRASPLSRRRR